MKKGIILVLVLMSCFYSAAQSTGKYQIKFLEINKENSDYGVAILDDNKLLFTSALEKSTGSKTNYNPRKELYVGDINFDGEISNVKPAVPNVDDNYNQTGATFSSDKKTVYFSKNNYEKKISKQELPKNQRLELFKASVDVQGNWTNIQKLPFNDNDYSTGHPVLNNDNSKLYFVSDRLPSEGKTDIFVVDILADGTYGKPKNLGKNINTSGTETTPFITEDGILYFSSDGHPGKGKLDVFAVEIFEEGTSEIYQLAAPINSINDDFAYIVNKDNNQGFFTSNRLQGQGFNDLYAFTLEKDYIPGECFISVDGKIKDKETQETISGASVDLYSLDGALLESVSTFNDGTYKFTVSCAKEYKIVASNDNYKNEEMRIEILEENYHSALHANLNLTKIREEKAVVESLQPIYYAFDDASINNIAAREMDKIVNIMNDNPNLMLEANAFTDSRGSKEYNKALSQRRAQSAVAYLISQGINPERIKSNGYGEDKLKNHCVDGVDCVESAHEMNRRTEFNFMKAQANLERKKPVKQEVQVAQKKPVTQQKVPDKKVPEKEDKTISPPEKTAIVKSTNKAESKIQEQKVTIAEPIKKEENIIEEQKGTVAKSTNKAESYIEDQKTKIINSLTELERKYDEVLEEKTKVADSVLAEKAKIADYKKTVQASEETGWANIIEFKNNVKTFNKRYYELLNESKQRIVSQSSTTDKKEVSNANSKTESSEVKNETSKIKEPELEVDKKLSVDNVEVIALKMDSQGKYLETKSAKKADLIKLSFKLLHNENVNSGQKQAHVILQDPEGKVTDAKGVFQPVDSGQKKYTDHAIINYEKNDVDVVMFIQRKGTVYEKGIYPVKLFLEGELVGVSKLDLLSPF